MRGQTIGKTMTHGFAGSYSRQPDCIVNTRPAGGDIAFGAAVIYDANGNVITADGTATADNFIGVAAREVKSATNYLNQNAGSYVAGDAVPVFMRGSVNVISQKGTPKRGGAVYIRKAANESLPTLAVGGFEAEADGENTVELTNCQWGGDADVNGVCELILLTRANA